jgi:hypothetical protein
MNGGLLVSYHYLRNRPKGAAGESRYLRKAMGKLPLVLDSGAYSASTQGVPIPILEFGRFIRRYGKLYDWVASLDVIGDPVRTRANWLALRREYPVVPTVHLKTELRHLDWYLNQKPERIAIGGMVGNRQIAIDGSPESVWLKEATERCVRAGVLVHGFGVTARTVLENYEWDSVDASTAVRGAIFRRPLVRDGDKLRACKDGDFSPELAAALLGEFEVVSHASRSKRIRWNVRQLMGHLENTGVRVLFHAATPNGVDELEAYMMEKQ